MGNRFIRLTAPYGLPQETFVNVSNITTIVLSPDKMETLISFSDSINTLSVKETPEEILELIRN